MPVESTKLEWNPVGSILRIFFLNPKQHFSFFQENFYSDDNIILSDITLIYFNLEIY
jgi:hypothetical protein